ncbi:hypothetical protein MSG28_008536 [Choristoneura fumiferana]|uniref:Uncharacterized protein n=1 Tax=Choristoneura fumiferana TaxID=7141 RepID=A0ACC0J740_CHOFU|nr:hypothetical protein MSG28_008536 [Choristoneura fumiferana]
MKYLVVLSLIAAVASAGYIKPTPVASEIAEIQEIIAAINSPSTDPATAAALEQLLLQTLGLPQEPAPISVGPALLEFPTPDGGAVTAEPTPVVAPEPTPAAIVPAPVVAEEAANASPLVQIILNINSASGGVVAEAPAAVSPAPAAIAEPHPVQVVDEAVNPPTVVPSPVVVVPTPVHVAEPAPVVIAPSPVVIAPEPIQIGNPIIPEPIVLLPDTLN